MDGYNAPIGRFPPIIPQRMIKLFQLCSDDVSDVTSDKTHYLSWAQVRPSACKGIILSFVKSTCVSALEVSELLSRSLPLSSLIFSSCSESRSKRS